MKKCKFCKKEIGSKSSMTKHMLKCEHDLISEVDIMYYVICEWHDKELIDSLLNDYDNGKLCCDDLRKSGYDFLNSYLKLSGKKRTNSEEKLTPRYKEKYKNTLMERYGVENASKLQSVKDKKKQTNIKTFGTYEKYIEYRKSILSKGYANYVNSIDWGTENERRKTMLYEKFGVTNIAQLPDVRLKISTSHKIKIKSLSLEQRRQMTEKARSCVNHRGGFRSKLEIKVQEVLIELKIPFETNKTLFGYNYDFVINNKILEINGDMWHGNPQFYNSGDYVFSGRLLVDDLWEKDIRKKNAAISHGYQYTVLWENDIKNLCKNELKNLLLSYKN